jgi:hypothetical protein
MMAARGASLAQTKARQPDEDDMAEQTNPAPSAVVKTWLAGFVYRGRAPWETEPAAYHVEIGQFVEVAGMAPVQLPMLVLTPDAAQEAGHALPDVLSAISAEALAELTELRATTAALTAQNAALAEALARAEKERDAAKATVAGLKAATPAPEANLADAARAD